MASSPMKNDNQSTAASFGTPSRRYSVTTTTTRRNSVATTIKDGNGDPSNGTGTGITSDGQEKREPQPLELSEPIVPEIYDPSYKRGETRDAPEWEFLESTKSYKIANGPRTDVSSTGAVANNMVAPRYSISERKRQLALGSLRARPDDEAIIEEDEQVAENLAKAKLNLTLNELLTTTRIAPADGDGP